MECAIRKPIGAALAACMLSGCWFGTQGVPRDSGTPQPARKEVGVVVAAQPSVVPPQAPAEPEPEPEPTPPVAPAPAVAATAIAAAPAAAAPPPLADSVQFAVDAYLPEPDADALLRAHAEQLKADPHLRLLIKGHGDARGSMRYNRALAAKRAEMVAKALRAYGVAARQLTEIAIGDDDPDAPDLRRVVLIYR